MEIALDQKHILLLETALAQINMEPVSRFMEHVNLLLLQAMEHVLKLQELVNLLQALRMVHAPYILIMGHVN